MPEYTSLLASATHMTACAAAAFFLTLVCVILFCKLAPGMGLMDLPGGRKQHDRAVPLVGGLAISVAVAISSLVMGFDWGQHWYFVLGACILLITGVWDDRYIVRSSFKFVIQGVVALLIVFGEAEAVRRVGYTVFGHDPQWNILSYTIAFFFILGFVNALNMSDGINGLAGLLVLIMSVALLLAAANSAVSSGIYVLLLTLIGAVTGFLVFNLWLPVRFERL